MSNKNFSKSSVGEEEMNSLEKPVFERDLEFHTTNSEWKSIPILLIGYFALYYTAFFLPHAKESLFITVTYWVFIFTVPIWYASFVYYRLFKTIHHLKIKDEFILEGTNVFGKAFSVMDIREIKLVFSAYTTYPGYFNGKHKMVISPDIDYSGFIFDYIDERLSSSVVIKKKAIKIIQKCRQDMYFSWLYTRNSPFNTDNKYPTGYLKWFVEKAEEQRKYLIEKGVLSTKNIYADREIHREEKILRKYIPENYYQIKPPEK